MITEQEEQNVLKKSLIDGEKPSIENNECLVKREPYNEFMDIVNEDKKWFLCLGVNKISKEYESHEALLEGLAYDFMDIAFRLVITVNKIENQLKN